MDETHSVDFVQLLLRSLFEGLLKTGMALPLTMRVVMTTIEDEDEGMKTRMRAWMRMRIWTRIAMMVVVYGVYGGDDNQSRPPSPGLAAAFCASAAPAAHRHS